MPDMHIERRADSAQPIKIMEATGFVVVSLWHDPASVVPPYKTTPTYDHYKTLGDAIDAFTNYENGEHRAFSAVGIFAVRHGMPLGGALDLSTIARMQKEVA